MDVLIPMVVFGALGVLAIGLAMSTMAREERPRLLRILLWALLLRMGLATMFALVPSLRFFHEDAEGYELNGIRVAAAWAGDAPPVPWENRPNAGFTWLSAAIYYVFGRFQVNVSYFNAVVGTLTVFLVYKLARCFVHPKVADRAAVLTAFVPSMILWSAVALKEPVMTLLIVFCLLSCVRMKQKFSVPALMGIVLPIVAMQPIRFYMVYFVGFAVLAGLLIDRGVGVVTGVYKQIFIAAMVIGLLTLVGFAGRVQEGTEMLSFERVSRYRSGMASTAESGFSADVDISTPGAALAFLPIGMSVLLLGPFPWQMTSPRALLAAPETILWWFMVPSLVRGLRFIIKERFASASPLVLFAVTLTCGYSLIHGNIGSAFRQRAQIFVFLFVFAALGWFQKRCRKVGVDEDLLLAPRTP